MNTASNATNHAVFPLLAEPERYRPCETDLLNDLDAQAYWLELFESHTEILLDAAIESGFPPGAVQTAGKAWFAELAALKAAPDLHGRLDILLLDQLRRAVLDRHGIDDEFRSLKQRENEYAITLLPRWTERIDESTDARARFELIVRGMLAGNLFDMGVPEMVQHYSKQSMPLDEALSRVPTRPWLVDDLDDAASWVINVHLTKVIVFVDNAGSDFVLGVMPLVRFLLNQTETVIIAANESPSHNDVTVGDVRRLLVKVAAVDPRLASDRVQVFSNGHAAPLLDLRRITPELAHAATDAQLVVLIGMGRSVESNLRARFTCPSWKVAMIKDDFVARTVGGRKFDAVFRFESAVSHPR